MAYEPIPVSIHRVIQVLKAEADELVGGLKQRLNDCGPKGNRSVETQLDFERGRSDAYATLLAMLVERSETSES